MHGGQGCVERCARAHDGVELVQVRLVVTANIHGLALHCGEFSHDGLLACGQLGSQRGKLGGQHSVIGLCRQRLRPVQGQIKLAATVVELPGLRRRVFVVLQQLAGGGIERLRQNFGLCVAGLEAEVFERYGQRQKLAQRIPAQVTEMVSRPRITRSSV